MVRRQHRLESRRRDSVGSTLLGTAGRAITATGSMPMVLEVLVAVVVLAAVVVLEGIAGVVVEATIVEVAARTPEALVSVQLQPQLESSLDRRKGKRRHRSRLPMS